MNELQAAFFYGDFSCFRNEIMILLSKNDPSMWVQQELFS